MAESRRPLAELVDELAARLGRDRFVEVCVALLGGVDRAAYVDELPGLTGLSFEPGSPQLDAAHWPDHWPRSWGARGLLHVWDDAATGSVVAGLDDEHWRVVEMCLKVVAAHEVAGAGDAAARLADHERPRVRQQVARALAVVGDTEHLPVVRRLACDAEPTVAGAADRALGRMGSRLDVTTLGRPHRRPT